MPEKNCYLCSQAFQLKKQQRLNELDQVVVLRLHQLLHRGPEGSPPSPLTPCLVFPASALLRLNQRIGELSVEKQQEKRKYRCVLFAVVVRSGSLHVSWIPQSGRTLE